MDSDIELAVRGVADAFDTDLPDDRLRALVAFQELVTQWGKRINLTGKKEPRDLAEVLFADALQLGDTRVLGPDARLVDVGAGAGAPAIPLAILRPDVRALLVEPLRKRVMFMRTALGSLGLTDRVRVHEGGLDFDSPSLPIEDWVPTVAMSRATVAPDLWLRAGKALAPCVLVFTGVESLPEPLDGQERVLTRTYKLPFAGTQRNLGVYAPND